MHLTISINDSGYHPASWRLMSGRVSTNGANLRANAILAERAGFSAALFGISPYRAAVRLSGRVPAAILDPFPLVSSLTALTQNIGLGAAYALDRSEPYNIARSFATLDRLSSGRSAWVIDLAESQGPPALSGETGGLDYARAAECIDVVRKLWDSWEDDAFTLDKDRGLVADPRKVHRIDHAGLHFSVRGPLNVPRPT